MSDAIATDRLVLDALNDPRSLRPWVRLLSRLTEEDQRILNRASTGASDGPNAKEETVTLVAAAVRHANEVNSMFERALVHHPSSYKVWSWYLAHHEQQQQWLLSIPSLRLDPAKLSRSTWRLHERAVTALPNMPLLWVRCLRHLLWSPEATLSHSSSGGSSTTVRCPVYPFTKIRIVMMRALAALPSTQHHLLWSALRRWCRDPLRVKRSPPSWLKQLWGLCLLSDSSDQVASEYIQVLTCLGAHTELLVFCSEQFASKRAQHSKDAAVAPPNAQQRQLRLFRDPLFWELISGILVQTKVATDDTRGGTLVVVNYRLLHDWIAYGLTHCVHPEVLTRAHALFLARRGQFIEARALLRTAVESCADPALFQDAFAALLHFEEQLIDCVALTESPVLSRVESLIPFLSTCVYRHMAPSTTTTIATSGNATAADSNASLPSAASELQGLLDDYPLLLNAAQLRQRPHDVRLWLKRVEAVVERAAARGISRLDPRTIEEMKAIFHQSFSLCRPVAAGDEEDDTGADVDLLLPSSSSRRGPASVLYSAWAQLLLEAGLCSDAVSVLSNGAFHVAFASPSDNHHLFGMLVEALCLTATDASATLQSLMLHLRREVTLLLRTRENNRAAAHATMHPIHPGHRRDRGLATDLFLSSSSTSHYTTTANGTGSVASAVLSRGDVWALALDVANWAEGPNGNAGKEIVGWMSSLGLYTAEVALLRSSQLFQSGNHVAAAECLDEALLQCETDAVAALALCEARLQFLLAAVRQSPRKPRDNAGSHAFPLEHVRAVYREGLRHGKQAFFLVPNRTVDFYFLAAACEESVGLAGNALTILRDVLYLAVPPPSEATQSAVGTNNPPAADNEGVAVETQRNRASIFLRCFETYAVKLLQLRGASTFFVECASLLKHPLSPEVMCEVVLRFTAQLARHGQHTPCRSVFQAASKVQDPKTQHGALFWGAWEAWERNNGDEENFIWTQRLKRNVQASFSSVEVVFDQ